MEHPCYKCGASVEDGTAFCRQCNAPQIRVAGSESAAPTGTPPEFTSGQQASYAGPRPPTAIEWTQALPAATMAGLLAAVLMLVPLAGFGLGMLAAGVLAVLLYRRRVPESSLTPGAGARLGAVSGALGFAMFAIFSALEILVFHTGSEVNAAMLQAVNQAAARSSDPQAQQALEYLRSSQGLAVVMAMGLVVMFLAFLIFSSIGGAIGAALLKRKERG